VTVAISMVTQPKPESELNGLVYGCTELPDQGALPLVQRPVFWGTAVIILLVLLQWWFW
jgi:SSS family solute:Na+ symporter